MERIKGRALKEGRADDASEDIINTRIVTYHNQTEPLIEYYSKAEKYNEIDGIGTIDEVRAGTLILQFLHRCGGLRQHPGSLILKLLQPFAQSPVAVQKAV